MKPSQTETRFWNTYKNLGKLGVDVEIEKTPADQFFGEKITISTFRNGAFASWTLRRPGKVNKRTSMKRFGMINGRQCNCSEAFRHITGAY